MQVIVSAATFAHLCVLHSGDPVPTEPGAGAGKTSSLVRRIVNLVVVEDLPALLGEGLDIEEIRRVLVPNGHLFIVSFNALSLWGGLNWARRLLPGGRGHITGHGSRKLCDWLSLLGFATADPRFLASFAPRGKRRIARLMDRFDQWLVSLNSPTGAIYFIHARKRVSQYLDSSHIVSSRARLISIPLGKSQEGVPVPRELGRVQPDSLESPP